MGGRFYLPPKIRRSLVTDFFEADLEAFVKGCERPLPICSEQPVPYREYCAVVAVGFKPIRGVVQAVHVGRYEKPSN